MPISPTVIASILYIGRLVVGNAAYLSTFYCLFAFCLGQLAGYFSLPPKGRVLGSWGVILDDPA